MGVLVILLVPALAFAAPKIAPNVSGAAVTWQAAPDFEGVTLVVMAPSGAYFTREFTGGQSPSFSLKDLGANLAVDGTYTWELRFAPRVPADVKRAIAEAREKGDDAAAAQVIKDAGVAGFTQSGVFSVSGGSFVSPSATEGPRVKTQTGSGLKAGSDATLHAGTNDVVTADDAIIQGSICVGLDCVNNESFGFDTVRLKENNTRIKFDDTSSSTGFPNHDWQLTANDSASGGANKFSIEDITAATVPVTVTGSAPTNSIFVDSSGRVGLRTSAPALDLHISTSNTPAIRQEQTNAGGFTAQTWDIGANEANWFVRDVTGGSRLPFRIRPGAPTSSIDIAADGTVGFGTASPSGKVHILTTSETNAGSVTAWTDKYVVVGTASTSTSPGLGFALNASNNAGIIQALTPNTGFNNLALQPGGGSVGIGTQTPASKLTVNGGDVRVIGGSFIDDGVTVIAPDYVFEPSYNLMSLTQVASYIKENKHLPNIPSASDFKKEGINLSKLQMSLLEKVEELTLHAVSQNDEMTQLRAENQKLQDRLAALEQAIAKK
ncbi:MAG TPA: hypothetical protein VJ901_00860 [Thermoanaerobaculia bacterium]|nr:hypothetical protein [Thermoanaerobaculia bacterium]